MGANKKIYGYYPTGEEWLPIQVDDGGKIVAGPPAAHHLTHENGSSDEVSVADLSGLLADSQTPLAHKTSHQDGGTDEIDITGLGTPTRARAYLSANQLDLVDVTWTKVLLDAENYDVGDNFANYKFTAPVAGYYLVAGMVTFTAVVATKTYAVALYKNGVSIFYNNAHSSLAYAIGVLFSDIVYLTAGQYLELYACSRAGVGTVDILGGSAYTYLLVNLLQV